MSFDARAERGISVLLLYPLPSVVGSPGRKKGINMKQRQTLLSYIHVLFFLGTRPDYISHPSLWLVEPGWTVNPRLSPTFRVHVSVCGGGGDGTEMKL